MLGTFDVFLLFATEEIGGLDLGGLGMESGETFRVLSSDLDGVELFRKGLAAFLPGFAFEVESLEVEKGV